MHGRQPPTTRQYWLVYYIRRIEGEEVKCVVRNHLRVSETFADHYIKTHGSREVPHFKLSYDADKSVTSVIAEGNFWLG